MKREEEYLYYILMDDDVNLVMKGETNHDNDPWRIYRDFLINTEPALGVLAFHLTDDKAIPI